MKVLGPLSFLASDGNLGGARSALIVQSGGPELLVQAVDTVRAALPSARLTVLLQRNMRALVGAREGVEYLDNTGSRVAAAQELRARRFDAAFVLYTNQPGYWKLKLLPFALGVPRVYAINEHMGWFPVTARHLPVLARHLAWRAGSHGGALGSAADLAQDAARAAAKPAIAAYFYLYEKAASARAALRGGVNWKDPPLR